MPKTFKDLMSQLATDTSENALLSAEEIQEVVNEVTAKDTKIQELTEALEKANKEHEDLKNRIVDKLFRDNSGKPNEPEEIRVDDESEPEIKTFDELIKTEYRNHN